MGMPPYHPLTGKLVRLKEDTLQFENSLFFIKDYFNHPCVMGQSWKNLMGHGNDQVTLYMLRQHISKLPYDDDVLYGWVIGHGPVLIHTLELGEVINVREIIDTSKDWLLSQ